MGSTKKDETFLTEADIHTINEIVKNPYAKRRFLRISQTANSILVNSILDDGD